MRRKSVYRLLASLLVLSLLLCSLPLTVSAQSYLLGDANGDGWLSVTDIVQMRIYILQDSADADQLQRSDMNMDGSLTVTDVVLLRNVILSEKEGVWIDPSLETPFDDLSATYLITSEFSGKVVCQSDGGSGFSQWVNVGAENQMWTATPAGDEYYILQSATTGWALTLADPDRNGLQLFRMSAYTGAENQKFKLISAGNGDWYLTVQSAGADCCMEISYAGLTENAMNDGWGLWLSSEISGSDAQKFSVTKAEAATQTFDAAWAEGIYDTFMAQFKGDDGNGGAYFIGTPDFWKTAELTEMILDCYEATGDAKYLEDYAAFYRGFINAHGTNWASNIYNDDIMWMVISCCRAYQFTKNQEYFDVAKENFDLVYARGYDDVLGGGIYWTTNNNEKNACVNGPAAIAACYLADMCGPTVGAVYLEYAKSLYAWERATLFNAENGRVYDHMLVDGSLNRGSYTYNQGTFIGAATLLYERTKDNTYLEDAKLAVNFTVQNKYQNGCINNEKGGDADGFKGILVRWMYKYISTMQTTQYNSWLALNITTGWDNRNSLGLVGTQWGSRSSSDTLESAFSYGTYLSLIMPYPLESIG